MGKTNYQLNSQSKAGSPAFSQSPTIPPTEDRELWLRDSNAQRKDQNFNSISCWGAVSPLLYSVTGPVPVEAVSG